MNTARAHQIRQRLIRLIHVAKRDLAMDDDTYRALLVTSTGHDSSSRLSSTELNQVLAHMKRRGFKVRHATHKPKPARKPSRALAQSPQDKKIRALWLSLHKHGIVHDASEAALAAYVKRISGIDALQWLDIDQASRVIETLKQWQDRIDRAAQQQQELPP